ncbi:tetratricopeptide repeat protein [uncultured Clostridium sp.]|uniref:tetratricopeptide repeat protein n=1 Tax=uncultured Clostridium sp. TaxID=59620 RepID=UPI0025E59D43|nr:hypothetical protein [uncultured Clostridium sp.]
MGRISLPGSEKHKKIILLILVLISVGILIYEFVNNPKNKDNEQKNEHKMEYITEISDSHNNEEELLKVNEISKKDNETISERERELYNEAYKTFFSGDYSEAINKADILINEFHDSYMGYNIRGIAKAYNGDFQGGMSDIDISLSMNKDYGYGRFNKALTYELYGQFDEALEWYNKALEIEDYVWTYYGIASIYGRRGDSMNTVKYLKTAIEMDEAVKEEAKTEEDFDPVRNSKEFQEIIE